MSIEKIKSFVTTEDILEDCIEQFHALCLAHGKMYDGNYGELSCIATGNCVPYDPGCHTLSNGDPGYPEEGGYAEEIALTVNSIDFTHMIASKSLEAFLEELFTEVCENHNDGTDY